VLRATTCNLDRGRSARGARDRDGRLGSRDRGEGRLRDVHAQGDRRTGGRGRHDPTAPRAETASTSTRRARWTGDPRGVQRIIRRRVRDAYHAGSSAATRSRSGRACPSSWTSRRSSAIAIPSSDAATFVIGISQSGETADTLAAMRLAARARRDGARYHEHDGSQATRECDGCFFTRAGRDRRRATRLRGPVAGDDVALRLAESARHARQDADRGARRRAQAPAALHRLGARGVRGEHAGDRAHVLASANFFLYIGRHVGLPVALEGALKLKEISYVSADAYAAGEMKHGPIARLDDETPWCAWRLARRCSRSSSRISRRLRARGARVIARTTAGERLVEPQSMRRSRVRRRLDAPAGARGDSAPAARVRDRARAAPERRSAA